MLLQHFGLGGLKTYNLVISANTQNYSVSAGLTAAGWNGVSPCYVIVTVNSGIVVGSSSVSGYALTFEALPTNSKAKLVNKGTITGKGGNGAHVAGTTLYAAENGGPALHLYMDCEIDNSAGTIQGGGGGGGAVWDSAVSASSPQFDCGGGGGAGNNVGTGGAASGGSSQNKPGSNGSLTAGGAGGVYNAVKGGNGGAPGSSGGVASKYDAYYGLEPPGTGGDYVVGSAYANWLATGTRYGGAV